MFVELGWVQKRGQSFLLHPLIEELVRFELSPDWENCDALRSIDWLIYETTNLHTYYAEEEHELEFNMSLLYSFAMHADLINNAMRRTVLYWLSELMTSDEANMPEPMDQRYNGLYEKLIDLIGTCNLTDEEVATIRGVHFAAWLSEYGYIFKRYIEEWLAYAHRQKNFDNDDERRFIGVYKLLIECMESASTEDNIPEQYQMPYDEMIAKYKRRIEELTDTGYRIRNPEDE